MCYLLPQYTNLVLYRQQQIYCYKSPKLSSCTCLKVIQVKPLSGFGPKLYSLVQVVFRFSCRCFISWPYSILSQVPTLFFSIFRLGLVSYVSSLYIYCNTCGRTWDQPRPYAKGNLLAVFFLYLYCNRLLFSWTAAGETDTWVQPSSYQMSCAWA